MFLIFAPTLLLSHALDDYILFFFSYQLMTTFLIPALRVTHRSDPGTSPVRSSPAWRVWTLCWVLVSDRRWHSRRFERNRWTESRDRRRRTRGAKWRIPWRHPSATRHGTNRHDTAVCRRTRSNQGTPERPTCKHENKNLRKYEYIIIKLLLIRLSYFYVASWILKNEYIQQLLIPV